MEFLRYMFATILGIFATILIVIVLFIGALIGMSRDGGEKVAIEDNSILKLTFSNEIKEIGEENPFEGLGETFGGEGSIGLKDILATIKQAKNDDRIKGIYFEIMEVPTGYAMTQEIRDALVDFKDSGKFIYAYGEYMSEKGYYLASVADKVYLNPQGILEFNGLSSKILFFKKMFEKVGIQPEVFRVGEFKSAVEPFLLEKMSEANRLQTKSYLESMYGFYLQNVSQTRGIAVERLKQISDSMLVRKAGDAVKYGLISDTVYYDQVEKELKSISGIGEDDDVKFISMKKYMKSKAKSDKVDSNQEIAVVIAEGTIVSGKGSDGYIGSDKIAKKLRELREDDDVKAVVLRINSPGGSALASDVMWREVRLMSEKKPIIASMSDVAASGGYYMAMGCDAIVAQPNTITGSIGIFGLLFNLTELMQNKIGINSDAVGTGGLSDFGDPTDGLTEVEKQIIQNMINDGYETFTSKAALGRKMPIDELKKYASGRVWTGLEAKQVGLVDALGGLQFSIDMAAEKAGLSDNYNVKYYPEEQNFIEKFTSNLEESGAKWMLKNKLGELYPVYQQLEQLKSMQGVQARLPYDVVID